MARHVTEVIASQSSKAPYPIVVTDSPMLTDARDLQNLKASSPIVVTELGMSIDAREVQQEKAPGPIVVTEFGMVYSEPSLLAGYTTIIVLSLLNKTPSMQI